MASDEKKTTSLRGVIWSDAEITCLLELWDDEKILVAMSDSRKSQQVTAILASQMNEKGFNRSKKEIQNKMKNLTCNYRECERKNSLSGNSPKYCR